METTNGYYQHFIDSIIPVKPTPVKPKHVKFLFDLTFYNKFNELVETLRTNINTLNIMTDLYKSSPSNPVAYTNLMNQLKRTINSGLIYKVIFRYFNQMTEVNVSPIFLSFIEKIIIINTKLDHKFTNAYEDAFKAIHNHDSDNIITIDKYIIDFETLLDKETLKSSFSIENNIQFMINEENTEKLARTAIKAGLGITFGNFTNHVYFTNILQNFSTPQPDAGGVIITRFRTKFIENGITRGIIVYKTRFIADIKIAVDRAV